MALPRETPPIDATQVGKLLALGGESGRDLFRRLLELFEQDAPRCLASLREAVGAGEVEGIERAAHALKGSAANLGAQRLAAVCGEVVARARAHELADMGNLASEIEREYAVARRELSTILAGAATAPQQRNG